MGSLSGTTLRYKPDLQALIHALFSGLRDEGRMYPYSIITTDVVWLRVFGLMRVHEDEVGWCIVWRGRQIKHPYATYSVEFVRDSEIGAFARKELSQRTVREEMMLMLASAWKKYDPQRQFWVVRDMDAVECILNCKFDSVACLLDSLIASSGSVRIECNGDGTVGKAAVSLGAFNLYDEPDNRNRLAWVGQVMLGDEPRYAYAFLDQNAEGRLTILRP